MNRLALVFVALLLSSAAYSQTATTGLPAPTYVNVGAPTQPCSTTQNYGVIAVDASTSPVANIYYSCITKGATTAWYVMPSDPAAFLKASIPVTGGITTTTPTGSLVNLSSSTATLMGGDSIMFGIGVSTFFQRLAAFIQGDAFGAVFDAAFPGSTTGQIGQNNRAAFSFDPLLLTNSILNGGANDGSSGTSTATLQDYSASTDANVMWNALPLSQKYMASNCSTTGTWANTNSYYAVQPTGAIGGEQSVSVAGNTVNCSSIPSTTAVTNLGVKYMNYPSASAFTLTIDGTVVTNPCTGTTTFTTRRCDGGNLQGFTRVEFAVTPATSHTVLLTVTTGGNLYFEGIDLPVYYSPTLNPVWLYSTPAYWPNASTYNTTQSTICNTRLAQGIPCFWVDATNGTTTGGIVANSTTDMATTAAYPCYLSDRAGHFNNCGVEHQREALQGAEYFYQSAGAGYPALFGHTLIFTTPRATNFPSRGIGPFTMLQPFSTYTVVTQQNAFANFTGMTPSVTSSSALFGGFYFFNNGTYAMGSGPYTDGSSGTDWAGAVVTHDFSSNSASWHCPATLFTYAGAEQTLTTYVHKACLSYNTGDFSTLGHIKSVTTTINVPFTITASATPAINAASSSLQTITLSANATPTVTGILAGQQLTLQICQPATGGPYTWAWPSAFHNATTIGTTASTCSQQPFASFSGTTFVPLGAGTTGVTP